MNKAREDFMKHIDEGNIVAALLIDQQSAYDVIEHGILLQKMTKYKFSKEMTDWFTSYLKERMITTRIQDTTSKPLPLGPYSTVQGSVMGGLLFLLYCNDYPAHRQNDEPVVYVDDNMEIASSKDDDELERAI